MSSENIYGFLVFLDNTENQFHIKKDGNMNAK